MKSSDAPLSSSTTRKGPKRFASGRPRISVRKPAARRLSRLCTIVWFNATLICRPPVRWTKKMASTFRRCPRPAFASPRRLVAVTEVVLAELTRRVAQRLEQLRDRRILLLQAERGARQADLGQACAQARLAGDEGGAPGGAALFAVRVCEHHALARHAVDVRRPVSHDAERVGADVGLTDVVAPNHNDVRLARLGTRDRREETEEHALCAP